MENNFVSDIPKPSLLFIHNGRTRFVQIDLDLLQPHFKITELYLTSPLFNPARIIHAVMQHDIVLGWFSSWHTFLPILAGRRFGKPTVLIVGGYDTANLPEADYGSQRGGLRRWIATTTMRQASHLITNSHSAKGETMTNVGIPAQKISVIYHGVPPMPPGDMHQRQPIVLTVGNVWRENLLRKGLLPFVESAKFLPDLEFVLVGKWQDDSINELRNIAPPNVRFTGFIPEDELRNLYQTASVYVQASLHEGFGMSVAEAMLGGCFPVITNCGSLPEVVGSCGVVVQDQQPESIVAGIYEALSMSSQARQLARSRILQEFTLERREQTLTTFIQQCLS